MIINQQIVEIKICKFQVTDSTNRLLETNRFVYSKYISMYVAHPVYRLRSAVRQLVGEKNSSAQAKNYFEI